MSLSVLTRGGGISGPTASIFVTGLSETDTVTASHDNYGTVPNPEYVDLPDGYTQLEYIESTGTQYIDTNYVPTKSTELTLDFAFTTTTNNWNLSLFGVGVSPLATTAMVFNRYEDMFNMGCGGSGSTTDIVICGSADTLKHEITLDLPSNQVIFDGEIKGQFANNSFSNSLNLWLFRINQNNIAQGVSAKIYKGAIKDNNTLVRNFVPVRYNLDSTVGLYDLVNGEFYINAGTDNFIEGPEVTSTIDGEFIGTTTINGKWTQIKNPEWVVPDGYTQLEYLESVTGCVINTRVLPSQTDKVSATFQSVSGSDAGAVFGCTDSTHAYYAPIIATYQTSMPAGVSSLCGSAWLHTSVDCRSKFVDVEVTYTEGTQQVVSVDGQTFTGSCTNSQTTEIRMFRSYIANDPTRNHWADPLRIKVAKMEYQGNLIRHFVPTRRNSDGVLGMYDAVSDVFFVNEGTGEFIAGAEVPQYFYNHTISPIKSLGLWTVTATDGEQTATQDVLVDAIAEYEIEMGYSVNYLMLYDYGDECEDITGGWSEGISNTGNSTQVSAMTHNDTNLSASYTNTSKMPQYYATTANRIDLSEYTHCGLFFDFTGTVSSYNRGNAVSAYFTNTISNTGPKLICNFIDFGDKITAFSGFKSMSCDLSDSDAEYVRLLLHYDWPQSVTASVTIHTFTMFKKDDITTLCTKAGLSAPTDLATLIADTASIETILESEDAVKYMVSRCTGDFMASFVASADCLTALESSPYKELVYANKHWSKFLAMVQQ